MSSVSEVKNRFNISIYKPYNDDVTIGENIRRLSSEHGIQTIIETGTAGGDTTRDLARIVPAVHTIEKSTETYNQHEELLSVDGIIRRYNGDSANIMQKILTKKEIRVPVLFYLDAHSNTESPILDEIMALSLLPNGSKVVIVIHDFYVPNTKLGYCYFNGKRFDIDYIKQSLDAVLQRESFGFYYHDEKKAIGCRRGVVYIWGNTK